MTGKRFSDLNDLQAIIEELEQEIDEQQATITELEEDKAIAEDYANIFEKENVKLRKQIDEQQATIRKLQDLCGESDSENAKLRIENKKLKDDLHNCRLNKNIISEKLKLWQDVHKEYDIYNINDFEKLMKKVKQKQ